MAADRQASLIHTIDVGGGGAGRGCGAAGWAPAAGGDAGGGDGGTGGLRLYRA
jgi:hypothetical protein